jgi:hypothetical protein
MRSNRVTAERLQIDVRSNGSCELTGSGLGSYNNTGIISGVVGEICHES